jgi:protein SCO1
MFKNKSYIWISFIILIFGIVVIPEIIKRYKNNDIVKGERLDGVENSEAKSDILSIMRQAPKFELTNQNNIKISNKDYDGKVYVLEFFFSTCPTICPKMNKSMLAIQDKFFGNPNFGLASITIDPEKDTPEALKKHAELIGVKSSNWHFLSGFEHSGLFALIDKNGNIRCRRDKFDNPIMYYDGLDPEGVANIQQDIAILLRE